MMAPFGCVAHIVWSPMKENIPRDFLFTFFRQYPTQKSSMVVAVVV